MNSLPTNFQFSQASLNDYVDCARRFQLRYLLEQDWPAIESEPLLERERFADLGRRFHRMIQQHVERISIEALTESTNEAELSRWWQNYLHALNSNLGNLPQEKRAEAAISIPFDKYRLTAHLDLIAVDADRIIIVDWKTERKRPTRDQLLKRMQTRVYRYIVTEVYRRAPGTVSMIYWFAEFPNEPEVLQYDAAQHANDRNYLNQLIQEIETRTLAKVESKNSQSIVTPSQGLAQDNPAKGLSRNDRSDVQPSQGLTIEWPKTPDERKCAYCTYRSLCKRGVSAGLIDPDSEDYDREFSINLEEIESIEY
jgi:CRISPR/Cas system-associated exonuclease Cas4 (RecB family)